MLARRRAYADQPISIAEIVPAVVRGLRPECPPTWPPSVSGLLERCWDASEQIRPGFDEVVRQLEALIEEAKANGGQNELVTALASGRQDAKRSSFCTIS